MSEYSAKSLRDARKAKAERMASADPHTKVDSSTWTPPDALNADVKTGMRPLSRRAFKSGGKVEGKSAAVRADKAPRKKSGGGIGIAMANKNMKAANEEREGAKHTGGMMCGGRAKKLSGGALTDYISKAAGSLSESAEDSGRYRQAYEQSGDMDFVDAGEKANRKQYNRLGGIKTAAAKLAGKAKINAGKDRKKRKDGGSTYSDADRAKLDAMIRDAQKSKDMRNADRAYEGRPGNVEAKDLYSGEQMKRMERGYKKGGRVGKMDGGPMGDPRLGIVQPNRMKFTGAQGTPYKKGGAVHGDEAMDKALINKMVKPEARTGKLSGGALGRYAQAAANEVNWRSSEAGKAKSKADQTRSLSDRKKADDMERKVGKRTRGLEMAISKLSGARPTVGEAAKVPASKADKDDSPMKSGGRAARKDGGRTKGKTNINIIIGQSKPNQDGPQGLPGAPGMGGMPGMRPPVAPIPMAPAPAPGGAPGMAPPPPPMPRKSGGRISKVARSYKDMEAGAGSGEGRLQKTDIASRLPKKKEDGENVYKGLGYPNKVPGATGGRTAKRSGGSARSYKDMDAGAGSGEGRLEKTAIQHSKRGR